MQQIRQVAKERAKGMTIETGTPLDLLDVVIAIALMFVAAPGLIRSIWRLKPPRTGDVAPSPPQLASGEAL